MSVSSSRRILAACILPAAAAVAVLAPGVAQASPDLTPTCVGDTNIQGWGSTLQEPIQKTVWAPAFNSTLYKKYNCSGYIGRTPKSHTVPTEILGPTPHVTYDETAPAGETEKGSGAGQKTWGRAGVAHDYGEIAFVGTDEGPSATTVSEIESNDTEVGHGKVLETIPVVQGAVAILIHLPTGCTSTSTKFPGRLVLDNETLENVWQGKTVTWSAVLTEMAPAKSGDKIECTESGPAFTERTATELAIHRVVREDSSGTTNIFKKYLHQIDSESNIEGGNSWVTEGNTNWPGGPVIKPAASGTGALLAEANATPGSITYANLANVREEGKFDAGTELSGTEIVSTGGGAGKAKFWAPIQDNGTNPEGAKYADPSLVAGKTPAEQDIGTVGESNCASTYYVNGFGTPFPPPSVYALWTEVTATTAEKKYSICGMTFDLAMKDFAGFGGLDPFTSAEARTAADYIKFIVNPKGGQKALKDHDYYPLPKGPVLEEAEEGAAEIGSGGL